MRTETPGQTPAPEGPPGLANRVVRGAGFSAGGFALSQIINLAAFVVLARLLVPAEFGVYAAATILLGLALLVTESGMASAVVQRRDRVEEAANTAVVATFATGTLMSLLALAISPVLGWIFGDAQVGRVAAAMSGVVLLNSAASVPYALLQRRLSLVRRLVIEPLAMSAFAATAIIAAENGLGVWALVAAQYANTAVDLILSWILVRWRPRPRLASLAMWHELVGFSRHVFTASAIYGVGWQADALVVGNGLGTAALGQFRYGMRIATMPFAALLAAASYVLFPALAQIADDAERLRPAFLRSLRAMLILAFPLGFVLVPLGVPTATIVFGEIWDEAGWAAAAMCAYPAGGALNSIASETCKAVGRPQPLTLLNAVWIGGSLALMTAMLPFGFRAVAAAISGGAVVGGVYALFVCRRVVGVPIREMAAVIAGPGIAATAMALAMLPVQAAIDTAEHGTAAGLALLAAQGLAAFALYAVVLRLIAPAASRELGDFTRQVLRRIRRR